MPMLSLMISPRPTLPRLLRASHRYRRPPLPPTAATTVFAAGFRCGGPFTPDSGETHLEIGNGTRRDAVNGSSRVKVSVSDSLLKEKWLDSMSCPFPLEEDRDMGLVRREAGSGLISEWVVGVDPDVSGALALLKPDGSGYSAQVYDTPHLQVLVGKRARKRPDAKSIVLLLRSLGAPFGTNAYIEQSTPLPKDGKQGWWSGGYTYGLWIGVLVGSGFSVVPVTSRTWKDHFGLSGGRLNKDDSRHTASLLFPSASSFLQRKKDHGRAEALLIAAHGIGLSIPESGDY